MGIWIGDARKLEAMNAYRDRIGSDLKSTIEAIDALE